MEKFHHFTSSALKWQKTVTFYFFFRDFLNNYEKTNQL